MSVEDVVGEGGAKGSHAFEAYFFNLLNSHLKKLGKSPLVEMRSSVGDFFSPEGFDGLVGPVVFEVKLSFKPSIVWKVVKEIAKKKDIDSQFQQIGTLVFVVARPIDNKYLNIVKSEVEQLSPPFEFELWGPSHINNLSKIHSKESEEIKNNLLALRVQSAVESSPKDWREERSEVLSKLKEVYDKGQFSLFLGAGVSRSIGIPDWSSLLNSLLVSYLARQFDGQEVMPSELRSLADRFQKINGPTALMTARYLRKGLGNDNEGVRGFLSEVTSSLYDLQDHEEADYSLIQSISALCMPRRTGAKVKSVVTYNFDDFFERQLQQMSIEHRCIYSQREGYEPEELPVFHVHGFIPQDRKGYKGLNESTLVFSEEGYHQIYSDPYHWSNLVQLGCFRENSCLMIGLSMTDPNLRRLLDISSRNLDENKHYCFMQRLSKQEFCGSGVDYAKKGMSGFSEVNAERFLSMHHKLNEQLMGELGVNVIWFERFDEIPDILNNLAVTGREEL